MKIWHNGTFTEEAEPCLQAGDRLRLGDGVFDTLLCIDGAPAHPDLHFGRLLSHAKVLNIPVKLNEAALHKAAIDLVQQNSIKKGRHALNTFITRGPGQPGLALPAANKVQPQIIMRLSPITEKKDKPALNMIIAQTVRRNEGSPLSQIKSCNYGDNILAYLEAQQKGANDAIMLNNQDFVTCASSGNIFITKKDKLFTPPLSDGVMAGITRDLVIKRYNAQTKQLTVRDLLNADGIYITNSLRGARPVSVLEGKIMPKPPLTIDPEFHLQ